MALAVSNRHIYVQFIDDDKGVTLASVSTAGGDGKKNLATAQEIGRRAADVAAKAGIGMVVVDRGGNRFHGRIRALVDAAVAAGLKISEKPPKAPEPEAPAAEAAPAPKKAGKKEDK